MKRLLVALALVGALFAGNAPAQTSHNTRLGVSLFWAPQGNLLYWPQLGANLAYIRGPIGADYIRVIAVVGGDRYPAPDGTLQDPWTALAIHPTSPRWTQAIQLVADSAASNGLKVHWTLIGTKSYAQTPAEQDAIVRGWFAAMQGRLHTVELLEIVNEYVVNGFTAEEVRRMGRLARSLAPAGFPIALSSLHGTHNDAAESVVREELARLYADPDFGGANVFTYHSSRVTDRWRPVSILRLVGNVARRNSEPRGPGASSGGDVVEPATLANDYLDSIRAGEAGYVYHGSWIWGGHAVGFPAENRYPNVWDVPGSDDIAARLRALRRGSAVPPVQPSPAPPTPSPAPSPSLPTDPIAVLMDLVRRVEVLEAACRRAGACP